MRQALHDTFTGAGGLEALLTDPTIETINIDGFDNVFVLRRDGTKEPVGPVAGSDAELEAMFRDMAAASARRGGHERRFDRAEPELSLQLPNGARMHALMDVSDRVCASIRLFPPQEETLDELVRRGELTRGMAALFDAMVKARRNIIVSGGPAAGKTTLLGALGNAIPAQRRVIVIEDTSELRFNRNSHPDMVRIQTRMANTEGAGEFDMSRALRAALRMSPDVVIVGEVRGAEVVWMAKAMSIGIDGSMCTVHAVRLRADAAADDRLRDGATRGVHPRRGGGAARLGGGPGHPPRLHPGRNPGGVLGARGGRHRRRTDHLQRGVRAGPGQAGGARHPAAHRHPRPAASRSGSTRPSWHRIGGEQGCASRRSCWGPGSGSGCGCWSPVCAGSCDRLLRRAVAASRGWRGAVARCSWRRRWSPRPWWPWPRAGRSAGCWPAIAVWTLPGTLLGAERGRQQRLQRLEGIATWTESLVATLSGAAGLEQTIIATAYTAPTSIRGPVVFLAERSAGRGAPARRAAQRSASTSPTRSARP